MGLLGEETGIRPKFFEKGLVLERSFPYVQFASQEALTV